MSDREIVYMAILDLLPDDRNPKRHDLPSLTESMNRFGYVEPITLDERTGMIVAGHGRLKTLIAAADAGLAPPEGVGVDAEGRWTVPVSRGWASEDDVEARAYLVASNRIEELGGWDDLMLASTLTELANADKLNGVGFSTGDLDDLMAKLEEADAEAAPPDEPAGEWVDRQVKSLVLDFPLEGYIEVTKAAALLRMQLGVETNAELFLAMLRNFNDRHPVST